jgi:TolB protein
MQSYLDLTTLLFLLAVLFSSASFPGSGTTKPVQATKQATAIATPSISGLKGKLAFVLEINEKAEIYVMNPDGTDLHAITNDSVVNWFPTFSPDGKQIAFYSVREEQGLIYVMNADGSNPKRIGKGGSLGLTWSPDGKRLAFADKRDDNYDIFVINVNGTGEQQLTTDPAKDISPTWSPDGKQILFETNRNNPKDEFNSMHLYIMDADGSNPHDLTPDEMNCAMAAWSPDSQTISYWSLRSDPRDSGLSLMSRDGSNKRRISTQSDVDPVWSPDGKYLAAWHLGTKNGKQAHDLVIMRPDGSGRVVVTNFDKTYRLLSWGK